MNDPKHKVYEQIEDYLSGKLTGKERSSFEVRLEKDPELAASVRLHQEVATAIATAPAEKAFKRVLEEEGRAFAPKQEGKVRKLNFMKWAVAATVLLAVVSWFVLQNGSPKEGAGSAELFAMAYEVPPSPLERSAGDLDAAYAAYVNKDYKLAAATFEKNATAASRSEDKYFQAISYISAEQADISKAIMLLDEVSRDENSLYQAAAKWYMAMAILKLGDKQVAKRLLEEIATQGPANYKAKAELLLTKY